MRRQLRPLWAIGLGWCLFGFSTGKYELPPAATPTAPNPAAAVLKEISMGLTSISMQAKKALVFVSVSKTMQNQGGMIDPFDLFGMGPQQRGAPMPAPKQEGLGSGFIIDLDKRYIITNNHVVEDADEITVKLDNGENYPAKVVGRDPNTDVAVIQIINEKYKRDGLGALVLGDSDEAQVGALVLALGAPFGLEASVSLGVISAKGRGNLQITALGDFIQTDAAINPGNSGGPLINAIDGKVWGMNTAIASRSGASNSVGFASPSNLVRQVATSLINEGTVHRGWVGVAFQPFKSEWAHSMKLPKGTAGVIALQVTKNGPADRAGIQPQDVITAVDNKPLSDESNDLVNIVGLKKPGEKVQFDFYRNGQHKTAQLEIGSWDGEAHAPVKTADAKNTPQKNTNPFGLSVQQAKKGLVITAVEANSPAKMEGLQPKDVILFANGTVLGQGDFYSLLQNADEVLLLIERNDKSFLVHVSKNRGKK